jgi:hypothetical protein
MARTKQTARKAPAKKDNSNLDENVPKEMDLVKPKTQIISVDNMKEIEEKLRGEIVKKQKLEEDSTDDIYSAIDVIIGKKKKDLDAIHYCVLVNEKTISKEGLNVLQSLQLIDTIDLSKNTYKSENLLAAVLALLKVLELLGPRDRILEMIKEKEDHAYSANFKTGEWLSYIVSKGDMNISTFLATQPKKINRISILHFIYECIDDGDESSSHEEGPEDVITYE